ncbi:MAG: isoaspartyl peptidase/L-asparaginase family protein [Caulobacterales bacterium]
MTKKCLTLALHGGAGAIPDRGYEREIAFMLGLAEEKRDRLRGGASALDVAAETVADLEACGLFVAGRGSSANSAGRFELDACLMDGPTRRAGAVAALEGFKSPIAAARAVMEMTPHVMLVGDGAAMLAREAGLAAIPGDDWFTPVRRRPAATPEGLAHGTVGCVVRDGDGALAAATSTGGVFGKRLGRVGDAPIPGCGTWADDLVAVSCTGYGEYFIRASAASQLAHRLRFGRADLRTAAHAVLADVRALGGDGGLIAVTADGQVVTPYNSRGMNRAVVHADGSVVAEVF